MARLLADENFPFPVTQELRVLGHNVITILELGKAGQGYPDENVLLTATNDNRAVLTLNRKHFKQLHQESQDHKGIILCTYNPNFTDQAQLINTIIEVEKTLPGKLIRVNRLPQ